MLFSFLLAVFFSSVPAFAQEQSLVKNACTSVSETVVLNAVLRNTKNQNIISNLKNGRAEELSDAIIGNDDADFQIDLMPWILLNSSQRRIRKAAVLVQESLAISILEKRAIHDDRLPAKTLELKSFFTRMSRESVSEDFPLQARRGIQSGKDTFSSDFPKNRELALKYSPFICARFFDSNCSPLLNYLVKYVEPTSASNFNTVNSGEELKQVSLSLSPLINEVISDPLYSKPLASAALKLLKRTEEAEKTGIVDGDFFSDLQVAFMQHGIPYSEAKERTWKIIGFYATRGASMSLLDGVIDFRSTPILVAMMTISSLVSYLDLFKTVRGNRSYSLPVSHESICHYGKPYHFWMAAYLSHHLITQKHADPSSAILAVHLAGELYEMNSTTWGRNPYLTIQSSTYSIYNNSIRWSLIEKDAGAYFGAYGNSRKLDIDTLFLENYSHGSDLPFKQKSESNQEGSADRSFFENALFFVKWETVMAPHSHLGLLK